MIIGLRVSSIDKDIHKDGYFSYCTYPSLPTGFGQCEFDLHRDTEYLPSRDLLEGIIGTTKTAAKWEKDGRSLTRHFEKLQENCSNTFNSIMVPSYGVASSMKHTIATAWRHWLAGKPVYYNEDKLWKWSPATNYPPVMRRINDDCAKHHKASLNEYTANYWDDYGIRDRVFLARDNDKYDSADGNWYRTEHGDLLFSAVLAKYFMQPAWARALRRGVDAATMKSIRESIAKLKMPKRCIAMHMRHGDSCGKKDGYTNGQTRKCPTFE